MTVATIVNKDVAGTVKSLTKQQLTDIFTAKVTNWKELGGPDEPIVLVTRPKTSGTRALFAKYALAGAEEASNKALETDNSGLLVQSVAQNKGAIGYVALPYLKDNSTVAALAIDGVAPNLENTYSGKYNVWGYEHIYTRKNPKAAVKTFIDYLVSSEYGNRIEELGMESAVKCNIKILPTTERKGREQTTQQLRQVHRSESLSRLGMTACGMGAALLPFLMAAFLFWKGSSTFWAFGHSLQEFLFSATWAPYDGLTGGGNVGAPCSSVGLW